MGIPKFYRWTSERYPCLSEIIKEYQIPEFDNLYLDMNGIIHNCSHPNDEDVHLRIPEQQIFKDIFHYIDFLFKMIKPCKVFFMAIDGVAPRAKMNQQRGRRFRSARLAEDQEAEAVKKGETLPSEERFDSNCITPGTEFMARLHEQLKYFVQVKMSTDPLWQKRGLVIYLSGHDVPGEGEHKIMDFIRHIRSKPDYDSATRHCLYGLDADLVMLGLSTHELKFSLLREEIKFSRPKKPKKVIKKAPKQIKAVANYDLSNVSLFTNEGQLGSMMRPPVSSLPDQSGSVVDGKSFAIALVAGSEVSLNGVVETATLGKDSDKTQNEPLLPSPPDESAAKGVYKAPLPEKTTFLLLHLSLMRDYIDFEFRNLKERLKNHPTIEYDLEKVIDDWILMNILVGNDFVPHLPNFHIVKGALPMLYRTYAEILPSLDGYLNESGILNLRRFETFINKLSQFDLKMFRETYDDMKYQESKTGKNIVLGEKMFEDFDFDKSEPFSEEPLEPMSPELKALAQRTEAEVFGETTNGTGKLCSDIFSNDADFFELEDSPEFRLEFLQHKRNYYISKLEVEEINTQFLEGYCMEYVRAIQWVLLYYYKGVSSWGWFYPYHYAPFSSDLRNFAHFRIDFDKGQPFRPFEQLLAVLPAQSRKLLPQCYQWLMTETSSPILDFYPQKFEQDLNGKRQDWEAVVLIPFIDERKLLNEMEKEQLLLSKEELHRNSKGSMMCYSHTEEDTGPVKSPGSLFPELATSHVKIEKLEEVTYNPTLLPKGIHPSTKLDTIYQGFPTLRSKPVKPVIENAEIKVFDFVTREESMILSLEDFDDATTEVEALARQLIGRCIWVNWPHLTYAYVTGLLHRKGKFKEGFGDIIKDQNIVESRAEKEFDVLAKGLVQRHLKCKGIKLGRIHFIVYAKMMEGRKVRCDENGQVVFQTQWSKLEQPFALKTAIHEERITEIFFLDRDMAKSYVDLYKKCDQVFYLGDKLFGALGTVLDHDASKSTVKVKFELPSYGTNENNMKASLGRTILKSHDYFTSYVAAGKCQISSYLLSRITGTVFITVQKAAKSQKKSAGRKGFHSKQEAGADTVGPALSDSSSEEDFPALEMKKFNVGLDLKFNKKNLEVRGYTSKRDGQWFYSEKAVELVNDYVIKFSEFVQFLTRVEKGKDIFDATDVFPNNPLGRVKEMMEWMEDRGVRDLSRIPTNTNLLDDEDIDAVWKYVLANKVSTKTPAVKIWDVRPNLLLKPGLDRGCVPPIPNSKYDILDRIVCVDRGAPIPVGQRGTVVGIQVPQTSEPEQVEESFKSTGAATLMTLIILTDPVPGIFDKPEEYGLLKSSTSKNTDELTRALASLLGVNSGAAKDSATLNIPINDGKGISENVEPKARLIKLYPYQVINLSQGNRTVKENCNDQRQLRSENGNNNFSSMGFSRKNHHQKIHTPLSVESRSMAEPEQVQNPPIRILQRQNAPQQAQKKNPFVVYNSKYIQEAKERALGSSANQATKFDPRPQQSAAQNPFLSRSNPQQSVPAAPNSFPSRSNPQQSAALNPFPTRPNPQQSAAPNLFPSRPNPMPDVLPWPPQPLMSTPLHQFFSVAALDQQNSLQFVPLQVHSKRPPDPRRNTETKQYSSMNHQQTRAQSSGQPPSAPKNSSPNPQQSIKLTEQLRSLMEMKVEPPRNMKNIVPATVPSTPPKSRLAANFGNMNWDLPPPNK